MVKYEVYIMRGAIDMNYFAEGLQGSGKSTLDTADGSTATRIVNRFGDTPKAD